MSDAKKSVQKKLPTAKKRMIQNEKRRIINKSFKSRVHTEIRKFEAQLKQSDANGLNAAADSIFSLMDKGVKRGIFKKNKAARVKSQVAKKTSALSA